MTPNSGQGSRKEGTKAGENRGCRERVEAGPRRLLASEDSDTGGQGRTHRTGYKGVPLTTGRRGPLWSRVCLVGRDPSPSDGTAWEGADPCTGVGGTPHIHSCGEEGTFTHITRGQAEGQTERRGGDRAAREWLCPRRL